MNKKLKQILNRYPMLEEDRNYIANLANGGGSSCNCPIVIDVTELNNDGTPVSLSRDIAKQILDGAIAILKHSDIAWALVTNVTTLGDEFPCNINLSIFVADSTFSERYTYNDEYQQLERSPEPI